MDGLYMEGIEATSQRDLLNFGEEQHFTTLIVDSLTNQQS